MRKIKVLRIIARLNIGGPAIHTILLTQGLNPERYSTVLVKGCEDISEGNMLGLAKEKNVSPIFIESLQREIKFSRDWNAFWKLYSLIKKEKPDIVHTHTAKAGALGRLAAKIAGVPIIIHTFHGNTFQGYFSSARAKKFLMIEKFLSSFTDKIITVSKRGMEDILTYKIAKKEKITHIPLGLELTKFFSADKFKGELRKEFGFTDQDLLIGIVARLVPIKGHTVFLQAAERVLQKNSDAKFLVVGDGELRKELEALTKKLGIEKNVFWTGFRSDLERIYADLDLVVLSSLNEGLPVAIIEAMSASRPVVSTDVGGVRELVQDNKNGIVVRSEDPQALADAIIDITSDRTKLKEMGIRAKDLAYPRYDIKRLIGDIENLYEELIKKKKIN